MLHNQPPPLENYNLFRTDRVLREAVAREAPDGLNDELTVLGELGGRAETVALGFDANEHPPQLRTNDRFGNRVNEARFHPAWHALMTPGFVAEAFLRGRLGAAGRTLGTLPPGLQFRNIIDRAAPVEAA